MDTQKMACPVCGTVNVLVAVINETRQYRCKQCGELYYTPDNCLGSGPKQDGAPGGGPKTEKRA